MRLTLLFICAISGPFSLFAQQISIDNTGLNNSPSNLIQNSCRGGGTQIQNITFTGNNTQQVAYYSNGFASINSTEGMLLSTGNVISVSHPNDSSNTGTDLGTSGTSDADIISLCAGQTAHDYIIVEFDIIPVGNELTLNYIFASEEYGEYVCSNQADAFAILISGPGISGTFSNNAKNIAIVPSSIDFVGINSVNNAIPGQFATGACSNSSPSTFYNDNTSGFFEFDGYTDVMEAKATVICDSTYHIKIILTDVGDGFFDSGLFFPKLGMFSNGTSSYEEPGYLNDSVIVEGCKDYTYVIYNAAGFSAGQTFNLHLGGTAINGVDYLLIDTTYTLTPSDTFLIISFKPTADGITEGLETITISFDLVSLCGDTTTTIKTIYIQDENPINVTNFPANVSLCSGNDVLLTLSVNGGFPPYNIDWNGTSGNNITVIPTSTTTYYATIYDQAGCGWFGNFTATVHPVPIVNAGPDITVCKGTLTTLGVTISGESGTVYQWTPVGQLNSGSVAYPVMNPQFTQTLTVVATGPTGCTATDNIFVTVLPVPTANAGPDQTITYLQTSASLSGTGSGTPYWYPDINLSCIQCSNTIANPEQSTTYTYTVVGANGCTSSDQVVVNVEVPTDVFVPSAFSPNGDGKNDLLMVHGYTIKSLLFKVYDQWGQEMFSTFDQSVGWDGRVNGTDASIGLYVYTLEVIFVNDAGSAKFAGEINLVR